VGASFANFSRPEQVQGNLTIVVGCDGYTSEDSEPVPVLIRCWKQTWFA